ncbi:Coa1p [Sporobolomyces salmoneus]|uniref:Coa1p n=1 Tax=Sporobolomyces salmoneus TaxID=183962 RepID=UPI00317FDB9A
MLQRLRTPLSQSTQTLQQPLSALSLLPLRSLVPSSRSISTSSSLLSSSTTPAYAVRSSVIRPGYNSNTRRSPTAIDRDLPQIKSRTPLYLSIFVLSALAWGLFLAYATNAERANSSVVRSLLFQLRSWPAVKEFLGDGVKIEPVVGDLVRIKGNINMLAGRIDVQFRVKGSKAGGTASFTSIRRGKQGRFEVLRWKVTRDDGAVLDLQGLDFGELDLEV